MCQEQSRAFAPFPFLLAILAAAALLRFFNLGAPSLWTDELSSYWVATAPTFSGCLERANLTQGMSPLYFAMERWLLGLLPHNEFVLRLPSALASLVGVSLVYVLSRHLFPDRRVGLVAAALCAVCDLDIYYAQEARPYALGVMAGLLSQLFFLKYLEVPRARNAAGYVLASVLVGFSHYAFCSFFLVQNAFVLWRWWRGRLAGRAVLGWAGCQLAILGEFTLAFGQLAGIVQRRHDWNWLRVPDLGAAAGIFASLFHPALAAPCVAALLLFLLWRRKGLGTSPEFVVFLVLCWLAPPVFAYVVSRASGLSIYDGRYLVMSLPPFYLLLAGLLCGLRPWRFWPVAPLAYLLLFVAVVDAPAFWERGVFCRHVPHDWRGALRKLQASFQPGDVVVSRYGEVKENWLPSGPGPVFSDYPLAPFHSFYWDGPPPPVHVLTYTSEEAFAPYYARMFDALSQARRVWLLGVDPPNTNYLLSGVAAHLEKSLSLVKVAEHDYSGVTLDLFVNPKLGRGGD